MKYCVWKNEPDDDGIIALDESADTCARLMGITRNSFYRMIRGGYSETTKWAIMKTEERGEEEMNKLTIIGNLTKDPELRTTSSGINVCSFTVAVNRKKSKDQEQTADFFNVSAWRGLAEVCSKFLHKGKKVCVVGSVSVRTWESNDKHGASLEVNAEDIEMLSPAGNNSTAEEMPY